MISTALEGAVRDGGCLTLVFHPFLEEQEDRFEVMRTALEELRILVEDRTVWCAPHQDLASWVHRHSEDFVHSLELDPTEACIRSRPGEPLGWRPGASTPRVLWTGFSTRPTAKLRPRRRKTPSRRDGAQALQPHRVVRPVWENGGKEA